MVSTVQSTSATIHTPQTQSNNTLSDSQKEDVASILENYDPDSLSQEDAQEIIASFEDLGITPSRDLANTMRESGFSASELGATSAGTNENESETQAIKAAPPPPPPPASSSEEDEEEDELAILLEELLAKELEEQEEKENEEKKELLNSSGSSEFENKMQDFASKITGLNDVSKQNVIDLMNKYSQNEDNLSKEDISSVVSNALNQVLDDASNYKQNSFYA